MGPSFALLINTTPEIHIKMQNIRCNTEITAIYNPNPALLKFGVFCFVICIEKTVIMLKS